LQATCLKDLRSCSALAIAVVIVSSKNDRKVTLSSEMVDRAVESYFNDAGLGYSLAVEHNAAPPLSKSNPVNACLLQSCGIRWREPVQEHAVRHKPPVP
jgi:hypothetical protein